jgi:hypothetical protein
VEGLITAGTITFAGTAAPFEEDDGTATTYTVTYTYYDDLHRHLQLISCAACAAMFYTEAGAVPSAG